MRASDLNPRPDLSIPPLPVICDQCRATGVAGDPLFSAIPDILAFAPVPVRTRADGWTERHQRAFIAGLAITGSPRQAARAIGKHAYGAERLRNARGGREFAAAWDAALDLARERETNRIHANLAQLAEQSDAENGQLAPAAGRPRSDLPMRPEDSPYIREIYGDDYDPDEFLEGHVEYVHARGRIREKMLRARRILLSEIAGDPARRAAWELLAGPVDWEKAERGDPQDNEPGGSVGDDAPQLPHLREPDMQLCNEAGLLGEFTGVGINLDEELSKAAAEELRRRAHLPSPLAGEDVAQPPVHRTGGTTHGEGASSKGAGAGK